MHNLKNKKFSFSVEKDLKVTAERRIGFHDIINAIMADKVIAFTPHPNQTAYPNQNIIYVDVEKEVYVVPCVQEDENTIFLKTLFPSRKARKLYL